jgi:hypothetical protein
MRIALNMGDALKVKKRKGEEIYLVLSTAL